LENGKTDIFYDLNQKKIKKYFSVEKEVPAPVMKDQGGDLHLIGKKNIF